MAARNSGPCPAVPGRRAGSDPAVRPCRSRGGAGRGARRRRPKGTGVRGRRHDLSGGADDVLVALEVEESGDLADDNVAAGIPTPSHAVAMRRRVEKGLDLHAAVDGGELLARRDVGVDQQVRHGVGHADEGRNCAAQRSQRRIASRASPRLVGDERVPWTVCTIAGTCAAVAAARPRTPALCCGCARRRA